VTETYIDKAIQAKSPLASQMFLPLGFKLEYFGYPSSTCCYGGTVIGKQYFSRFLEEFIFRVKAQLHAHRTSNLLNFYK
jgi:hypothetical protein